MRAPRHLLAFATAGLVVASCVLSDGPTEVGSGALTSLALQPALIPSAADGSALPIHRIHTVVARASDGVVLREQRFDVSPTAATWSIEVEVPASGQTTVIVYVYLLNVAGDGTETVQFSGRTQPTAVTPGEQVPNVDADIVRGPLANLSVTNVAITAHPDTVFVGASATLSAVATASGGVTPEVFWTALDPAVLSAADSVVTGVTPGNGRVVASAGAFADTVSMVVVVPPVDSVRVLPDSADVVIGGTRSYTSQLHDAGGNLLTGRVVRWSTANPLVATVDSITGVVSAMALGSTTVRATSEGVFDDAVVRVVVVPVRSVRVSPDSVVVAAGGTTTYTAQTFDSIGGVLTGRTIAWTTANAAIATVDPSSGVVSGVSTGTTTVRATSEGVFDDATVRVTAAAPGGPVNTWTGADGFWSNAANWSLGRIPIAGDTVRITQGADYVVTLDVASTVAHLTVGATITLEVVDQDLNINGTAAGPDLVVQAGAQLTIEDGTVQATNVAIDGSLAVDGDATILATSLDLGAASSVFVGSDWVLTTNAVDIHSAGTLTVESGATLIMGPNTIFTYEGGSIPDSGVLFFTPGSELVLQADLSVDGPILFMSDGSITTDFPAERLTIGPQSELEMLGSTGLVEIQPKLVVQGDFFLEAPTVAFYDSLTIDTGGVAIVDGSGGSVQVRTENVVNRGQLYFSGLGLTFGPGSTAGQSIVNESGGQVYLAPGATRYTLNGTLTNAGQITVASETVLQHTDVSGTTHATAHHVNSGLIDVVGAGRFQVDLGGSSPTFTNSGTLSLSGSATFMGVSNLASPAGTIVNTATGVLNGTGTVDVRTGVPNGVNHGTIAPGLSPGTLTWLGAVPMGPTGRIAIELEGTAPGTGHDQLNASFDLVLNIVGPANGILDVTAPSFTPADGDRFAVLTFNERQGNFAQVNLPPISGVTLDTVWTSHTGGPDTLFVVASGGAPAPPNLNRWTGAIDPDWHKPGNWSKAAVPVAGDSVVIDPAGAAVVRMTSSTQIAHLNLGGSGLATLSLMGPGLSLVVTGTVTNNGYISFDDNASNGVPMVLSVQGGITIGSPGTVVAEGTGDVPELVGPIANSGAIMTSGQPLIIGNVTSVAHVNAGFISAAGGDITISLINGSSSLTNSGTLLVQPGNTIVVDGGILINSSVGVIGGIGTLDVTTTSFANDGGLLPGIALGVLTVVGNYTWGSTSNIVFEIDGLSPGTYDQLVNTGAVDFDGSLYVSLLSPVMQAGDSVPIMTFPSRTGTFANVSFTPIPGIALDTVWADGPQTDTLYIVASAATTIPLGAVIGPDSTDAQDVDGPGNAVNFVGTAVNGGATTLAVGPLPPTADFNTLGGNDRTNGFDRSDLLRVLAGRKHDGSALLLDLDNDGVFTDETPQPGFGMHAARFITFDLVAIRANASLPTNQAFTLSGYAGPADYPPSTGMSLVVLVDGIPSVLHDVGTGATTSIPFVVPVGGSARYLTFVSLEGTGLDEFGDHGGFAQVLLQY